MANTVPVVGSTFTFGVGLWSQADANLLQVNPTIAAGDFQISTNGGAFQNLDNLPAVTPAGGRRVLVTISAAETTAAGTGGEIWVQWVDAADDEWYVGYAIVRVHAANLDSLATATDLATVDAIVDAILADTGTDGVVLADGAITAAKIAADAITAAKIAADAITSSELAASAVAEIADGVLDETVEGAYTLRQIVRLLAAAVGGKASGGGTTAVTFRDLNDGTNRIVATVDANGNRTVMTLDVT